MRAEYISYCGEAIAVVNGNIFATGCMTGFVFAMVCVAAFLHFSDKGR